MDPVPDRGYLWCQKCDEMFPVPADHEMDNDVTCPACGAVNTTEWDTADLGNFFDDIYYYTTGLRGEHG